MFTFQHLIQLFVYISASSRSSGSSISATSAASTATSLSQDGTSSTDLQSQQQRHLSSNSPKENLESPSAVAAAMFTVEALKIRQQELNGAQQSVSSDQGPSI